MSQPEPISKICPSCGKTFFCYGDADCWCEKVRINQKEMLQIMHTFTDCLCPVCLEKYAEKS